MKKNYLSLFVVGILFLSCGKEENKEVVLQAIKVVELKSQNVPIHKNFVGQIYGIKDIPIRARVDGFLEGIYFEEGTSIEKNKLLYTIDPQPLQANLTDKQSEVSAAKTNLAYANSEYDRIKPLADLNAVSKSDLDAATAQKEAAEAGLESAKATLRIAQIELSYSKIYSPINGIIGKTMAREGEYVGKSPNPVILTTISQIESVRFQFFLTESEYLFMARRFTKNKKDNLVDTRDMKLELILSDGSIHNHEGKIDFIDRGVDADTGAILVQASFPNPDLILRPGQFGRIRITVTQENDVIIVPQRCISELQGQYSVFVVNSENKIESRQIKIGDKYNDYFIIMEGLKENEKVVLEGMQKVRNGMEVEPTVVEFNSQMESDSN